MADARTSTLLEFAIAASLAVVPVLLGRPAGRRVRAAARRSRRARATPIVTSASRHVAALKTFERAIVRRDRCASPPATPTELLERPRRSAGANGRQRGVRRSRALRALAHAPGATRRRPTHRRAARATSTPRCCASARATNRRVERSGRLRRRALVRRGRTRCETPVEAADYPGRSSPVRCADIARAVDAARAQRRARCSHALAWRGTEVERAWRAGGPSSTCEIRRAQVARGNPWRGVAGCIYMAAAARRLLRAGARTRAHRASACRARCATAPRRSAATRRGAVAASRRRADARDDARWKVPPSLPRMLQPLEPGR